MARGVAGVASTPLVEVDGVVARRGQLLNPAQHSGNQLVFTPPLAYGGPYYYETNQELAPNLGGEITIAGACSPGGADNTICVSFLNGHYFVNSGDVQGAVDQGPLVLLAGTTYNFEVVGDAFAEHPFALINEDVARAGPGNTLGALDGASGDIPAQQDDDRIVFTPRMTGARNYYYQSTADDSIGGTITVLGTCIPTNTHICVTHNGEDPGAYLVNQGEGTSAHGTLHLQVLLGLLGLLGVPFVISSFSQAFTGILMTLMPLIKMITLKTPSTLSPACPKQPLPPSNAMHHHHHQQQQQQQQQDHHHHHHH